MHTDLIPQLDERSARKLIARINASVEDVANLLIQLYHGKGWAAMGYTCWRECCTAEFGKSASWACRQIKAAELRQSLGVETESHARELRHVPEGRQAEVWEVACEAAGGRENVQASDIRQAAEIANGKPCWNCGSTERDEDGECGSCHEPTPDKPPGTPSSPVDASDGGKAVLGEGKAGTQPKQAKGLREFITCQVWEAREKFPDTAWKVLAVVYQDVVEALEEEGAGSQ